MAKNLIDNSLQADKTNKEPASLDKSSQCRKELRNKIREIKAENPTKTNIESPMLSPLGSPKSGSPRSRGISSKIDMSLIIKNKQNLEKEITRLEGVVDYERKQADKYCEVLEEKNRELNEKTKIIEEINAECNRLKSELELINKETTVIIANLEHREKSVTNDLKNSEIILNDLNKQLEDFNTNHSDCNHNQTITSDYKTFKKNIPIMLKSLEESLFSKITSISQKVTDKSNDLDQAFKKYRDHIDDLKNSKSAEEEYILSLEEKVEHLDFMLQQSQELNLGTITDLDEDVKQLENQKKRTQKTIRNS